MGEKTAYVSGVYGPSYCINYISILGGIMRERVMCREVGGRHQGGVGKVFNWFFFVEGTGGVYFLSEGQRKTFYLFFF